MKFGFRASVIIISGFLALFFSSCSHSENLPRPGDALMVGTSTCDITPKEPLPSELVRRFYERLPGQLHNRYVPTKSFVDVTYWACSHQTELAGLVTGLGGII